MTEAELALGRPSHVAAQVRAFAVPRTLAISAALGAIAGVAFFLRLWDLNAFGFNSDEAVYAGQAASIADHPELKEFFPTFRAHPLLFQTILSVGYHLGGYDLFGRVISAVFGVATVFLVYKTGKILYGTTAGLIAALFMALMPYHVVVTRQVLLDGPMVFFATLSLCLVVMYATTAQPAWLYAAGGAMGCTVLAKETSILLVGSLYAFFALAAKIRVRIRDLLFSGDGRPVPGLAALPATEPRPGLLRRRGPARDRLPRRRGRGPRTDRVLGRAQLAREAAAHLDRRPGRVLRALAGEGLPVPAADRARDCVARGDVLRALVRALRRADPEGRARLDRRGGLADVARLQLAPDPAADGRHVPRRLGRRARRP
jgi:hypothetical protein